MEALVQKGMTRCDICPLSSHQSAFISATRLKRLPFSWIRSIGVSNFSIAKLQHLVEAAEIRPAVNQVCCAQEEKEQVSCRAPSSYSPAYHPLHAPHDHATPG